MLQGLSCSSYMTKLHPGMHSSMNPRNDVLNHGYKIWSVAILRPDFVLRYWDWKWKIKHCCSHCDTAAHFTAHTVASSAHSHAVTVPTPRILTPVPPSPSRPTPTWPQQGDDRTSPVVSLQQTAGRRFLPRTPGGYSARAETGCVLSLVFVMAYGTCRSAVLYHCLVGWVGFTNVLPGACRQGNERWYGIINGVITMDLIASWKWIGWIYI